MQSSPAHLAKLPAGFKALSPTEQARALLVAKAKDALQYVVLRAAAVNCAPNS